MTGWRKLGPTVVAGTGLGLFGVSAIHFSAEIRALHEYGGPLYAFVLNGGIALLLAAAGYRLHTTRLSADHRIAVAGWSTAGVALFDAVIAASIAIRRLEGRAVTEPLFPLVLAAGVGGLAGFVAGYYNVRAHRDAERAVRASDAAVFVNSLLRHDVKNSVGIIRGNAEFVASETTGEVADSAETIRRQTERIEDRIESAGVVADTLASDPGLERVDLAAIAANEASRVADAYDATVTTDLPESAPVTANDALESVVGNLVENAAEHNDADDPRVRVDVTPGDETTRLHVRDNGPGVNADTIEALADDTSGLALADTLVDQYGGTLTVDTHERGATFTAELPSAN